MQETAVPGSSSANNLKGIRKGEGLTIGQLQGYSGMSTTTIREIENRSHDHAPVEKQRVADGLNANPRRSQIWIFEDIFPNDQSPD